MLSLVDVSGRDAEMTWKGKWQNQYGSIVDITDDANRRISGTFKTALKDSGFYGQEIPVVGIHQGDCISFVAGAKLLRETPRSPTLAYCATAKWKRCGLSSSTV